MLAYVTYEGGTEVTARGVCWSLESNPTVSDNVISLGSGLGEFSGTMNNLNENTSYYVRAFATNSYGTAYGEEYMVTTPYTPIFNNTISGDQDVCEGVVANTLIGSTPTGGDGSTYTYQWIMSTDSITWTESTMSSLSTGKDLEMRQLFTTTYFRRVVYSTMVSDTSNVVTITISPTTTGFVERTPFRRNLPRIRQFILSSPLSTSYQLPVDCTTTPVNCCSIGFRLRF